MIPLSASASPSRAVPAVLLALFLLCFLRAPFVSGTVGVDEGVMTYWSDSACTDKMFDLSPSPLNSCVQDANGSSQMTCDPNDPDALKSWGEWLTSETALPCPVSPAAGAGGTKAAGAPSQCFPYYQAGMLRWYATIDCTLVVADSSSSAGNEDALASSSSASEDAASSTGAWPAASSSAAGPAASSSGSAASSSAPGVAASSSAPASGASSSTGGCPIEGTCSAHAVAHASLLASILAIAAAAVGSAQA